MQAKYVALLGHFSQTERFNQNDNKVQYIIITSFLVTKRICKHTQNNWQEIMIANNKVVLHFSKTSQSIKCNVYKQYCFIRNLTIKKITINGAGKPTIVATYYGYVT